MRHAIVVERSRQIRLDALAVPWCQFASVAVDDLRLAVAVFQEQAAFFAVGVFVDQNRCVGEACQIVEVDLASLHQAMDHRQDVKTVGAGRDADPFICNSVIAGTDRVHTNDFSAVFLSTANTHLDWV